MKFKLLLLVAFLIFSVIHSQAQVMTVATYNMRNDNNSSDSMHGNGWKQRYPVIAELIRFHDFDIFGTQECLYHQVLDISKELPQYYYYGIGRDDGRNAGEHSEIFFKKNLFRLIGHGDFWLSQTPEVPSMGWDATCCYRICSWVHLQDRKTGKKFYVFNAHYDYQKDLARNESSKLVLQKVKSIAGKSPVIFMGDMNGGNNSEWYKRIATSGILTDTYREADHPYAISGSFNGFGNSVSGNEIIDHIFASKQFSVQKWGILSDTYHGKYPSDHFPVLTELRLTN